MKLHDFLSAQGGVRTAATRPVKMRVVGLDPSARSVVAEARAEIAHVSERERQQALREADRALHDLYLHDPVPEDRREDERTYHILQRALRDADDVRQPFSDSVTELKSALVLAEARRVWAAYVQFMEEEFPDQVDGETFERLVEEAKKASVPDLIASFGFDAVRRSMPGLLATLRT